MSPEPKDVDLAGVTARYWAQYDGLADFAAFAAVDDLLALGPTTGSVPLVMAVLDGATDDSRLAYLAAGPLTDLIHMEDERVDEGLRALVVHNPRLRRALALTQVDRSELSRRYGLERRG